MVGGVAITQDWNTEIGADGFAESVIELGGRFHLGCETFGCV